MAKRKRRSYRRRMPWRRSRRRRTRTIPIAPIMGLVAGFSMPNAVGGQSPLQLAMSGDFKPALDSAIVNFTGVNPDDGSWDIMRARGLMSVIAGLVVHKVAGALGGNRVFTNLPSPLNKLRI